MEINIEKIAKTNMQENKINVIIEHNNKDKEIEKLIKYIKKYNDLIIVQKDYQLIEIYYNDIVFFYSKEKSNYCRTMNDEYKIKSRLYEIERLSTNFIRISKNCIINIQHVKKFDMSQTGKIKVILENDIALDVSRRKIRDMLDYFDERRI